MSADAEGEGSKYGVQMPITSDLLRLLADVKRLGGTKNMAGSQRRAQERTEDRGRLAGLEGVG